MKRAWPPSAKKAGRIAAEGMAYATVVDGVGVVVEVNAETDFVGKNEKFVDFVKGVAAATVAKENPADLDALMECKYNGTDLTVTQQQQEMVLVIGENIKVRRFARFEGGVSVALCPRRRQDRRAGEPGYRSACREGGRGRQGCRHADRRSESPVSGTRAR